MGPQSGEGGGGLKRSREKYIAIVAPESDMAPGPLVIILLCQIPIVHQFD